MMAISVSTIACSISAIVAMLPERGQQPEQAQRCADRHRSPTRHSRRFAHSLEVARGQARRAEQSSFARFICLSTLLPKERMVRATETPAQGGRPFIQLDASTGAHCGHPLRSPRGTSGGRETSWKPQQFCGAIRSSA
jgi:hypothetical protein